MKKYKKKLKKRKKKIKDRMDFIFYIIQFDAIKQMQRRHRNGLILKILRNTNNIKKIYIRNL